MPQNIKILITEDDQFLQKILKIKMEKSGFIVMVAEDGEDALNKLKNEVPDIILLDMFMPKKSGIEVLKELKADERLKNIPVIMLSNLTQTEDVQKAMAMGASDYIIKSDIDINEIPDRISKYVSK